MKHISTLLFGCLLVACTSNGLNDMEPRPEVDLNAPIIPTGGWGGMGRADSRAGGGGVVSPSATTPATAVSVIRVNEITAGTYPTDLTTTQTTGPHNATLSGDTQSGAATPATVTFDAGHKQYYLGDGRKTNVIALYPQINAAAFTASTAEVTYTIDGSTDVMSTQWGEGNKSSSQPSLQFEHLLAQVHVQFIVADAGVSAAWGTVSKVEVLNRDPQCKVTLATLDNVTPSAATGLGTKTDFQLTALDGTAIATPLTVSSTDDTTPDSYGYAMFVPTASTEELPVKVTTSNRGVVTVNVKDADGVAFKYEAGKAYNIVLKLTATGILPTCSIAEWEDGGKKVVEVS